jgi:hypothetical protein
VYRKLLWRRTTYPNQRKKTKRTAGERRVIRKGVWDGAPGEKKRYRETLKRTIGTLGRKRERE